MCKYQLKVCKYQLRENVEHFMMTKFYLWVESLSAEYTWCLIGLNILTYSKWSEKWKNLYVCFYNLTGTWYWRHLTKKLNYVRELQPMTRTGPGLTWATPMTPTFLEDHLKGPWNSSQWPMWDWAGLGPHPWLPPFPQMSLQDPGTLAIGTSGLGNNQAPPMSPQCWASTSGPRNSSLQWAPPQSHCCHWGTSHLLDQVLLLNFGSYTASKNLRMQWINHAVSKRDSIRTQQASISEGSLGLKEE